ncbi:aminoglycoside phosphotransferase family protein [Streptomyces sp. HUAS MG47]|uniref:aminoglycoside phosphotransferase family protein n=1 Tax=Streptomyces solicamelliae TaxID=3231716 RepID=UPI003877D31E
MRHDMQESVDRGDYAHGVTPWDDPVWRDAALGWARERLAEHGLRELEEEREQGGAGAVVRLRPWSVLVRLTVGDDRVGGGRIRDVQVGGDRVGDGHRTVWFKAGPPDGRFEAGLAQALAAWTPEHVLAPLAVDTDRGWALMPDGGTLFAHELDRGPADPRAWEAPLRQYAALQRTLTGRTDELLALGVPDGRPAALPAIFDRLVEECRALRPADRTALRARRPRLVDWCDELAASGVPDSLDHSDLQESQIFSPREGRYTFFDWGDAVVAHPFSTLLVTARLARRRFGPDVLPGLRDAYLEAWTGDGTSPAELRRTAALATRLAAVHRAVCWGRGFPVRGDDGEVRSGDDETAEAMARWLRELFAEPGLWDTH